MGNSWKSMNRYMMGLGVCAMLVGCGVELEQEPSATLEQSEAALCGCDPIIGSWRTGSWGIYVNTDGSANLTSTAMAECRVGSPIFRNITRVSCSSSTQCNYTATRYAFSNGVTCPLESFGVTITVNGSTLTEYRNGQVLATWIR